MLGRYEQDAFDFIARLAHLSEAEIRDAVRREIARFGFDRLLLTGNNPRHAFQEQVMWCWAPRELLEEFNRHDYFDVDPVLKQCRRSWQPFEWKSGDFNENPVARKIMALRADFGVRHAFITPYHGPGGYEAALGFSGDRIELPPEAKPALRMIAYAILERLREQIRPPMPRTVVTGRERELLLRLTQGKNALEVAELLKVSDRTVATIRGRLRKKLNARTNVQLGAIAVREGLVP